MSHVGVIHQHVNGCLTVTGSKPVNADGQFDKILPLNTGILYVLIQGQDLLHKKFLAFAPADPRKIISRHTAGDAVL